MKRQPIGRVVNGKEHQDGELRRYGSWTIERLAEDSYRATIGNAMVIREPSLTAICRRIDVAGRDL
jgi:hypothetical protein